jgi:O-antigen/teichoic acid export membrane protein
MPALLRHATVYSIGSAAGIAASLISFPLLTRLLSVDEYGLMNTVALTLSLLVAFGKLGMQRATIRFYTEDRGSSADGSRSGLVSTQVLGMIAVGVATTLLFLAATALLPPAWLGEPRVVALFTVAAALIALRVADSAFTNLLYAQERSASLSLYNVGKRYLTLALVIGALLAWRADAAAVFAATILAEALCLIVVALLVVRHTPVRTSRFSLDLFRRMAAFGIPMIGVEMAWSMLAVGDRYVIQHLMGAAAVGVYAAAYNLCEYVKTATVVALATAVAPIYHRLWAENGRLATEAFLDEYARGYMAFALFVAALVTVNAHPLITLAASSKYSAGTVIVPWVMLGMALESYVTIAAAGLMIQKRTGSILVFVSIATVLNIALNYLLIPLYGLSGAAAATLLAFAFLMVAAILAGKREINVRFPLRTTLLGGAAFGFTAWTGTQFHTPWLLFDLVVRSAWAVAAYWCLLLLLDPSLRADLKRHLPAIRARLRLGS